MTGKLPREQMESLVCQVQRYFQEARGEEMGNLEAEQLIDFFRIQLGPLLYNQAVQDCRKLLVERLSSLEDELYVLEKPIQTNRR